MASISDAEKFEFIQTLFRSVIVHHVEERGINSAALPGNQGWKDLEDTIEEWIDEFFSNEHCKDFIKLQIQEDTVRNSENFRGVLNFLRNHFYFSSPNPDRRDFVRACTAVGYAAFVFGVVQTGEKRVDYPNETINFLNEWIVSEEISQRHFPPNSPPLFS